MEIINKIINGDCLEEHEQIENGSVDLIVSDPPYGNIVNAPKNWTVDNEQSHKWDNMIKPTELFNIANKLLRKNGRLILFSQEPYTSNLINNSLANLPFSYKLYWYKNDFANALLCNKAPVSYIEEILVFSKKHDYEALHPLRDYFSKVKEFIGTSVSKINNKLGHRKAEHTFYINSTQFSLCTKETYQELIDVFNIDEMECFKTYKQLRKTNKSYDSVFNLSEGQKYKSNILEYSKDYDGYHPTQKPVVLLEDLIKTYSNKDDLVVDLTAGSGTTAIASINTNRNYICIEQNEEYYQKSLERVNNLN